MERIFCCLEVIIPNPCLVRCLCQVLPFFVCILNLPLFICPFLQNDLDDPERGMIFVCSATHKTKSMFFFLAQTEQGDIFKVTLETDEEMVSKYEGLVLVISILTRCCMLLPAKQQWSVGSVARRHWLISMCYIVSQVTEIRLKYFDTIPVATAMCVLKTGFLFVSSEFGNQ